MRLIIVAVISGLENYGICERDGCRGHDIKSDSGEVYNTLAAIASVPQSLFKRTNPLKTLCIPHLGCWIRAANWSLPSDLPRVQTKFDDYSGRGSKFRKNPFRYVVTATSVGYFLIADALTLASKNCSQ